MSPAATVGQDEIAARTIRRGELVSCNQAFIDCRTPGSDRKENYALIGPGVSQNPGQFINLRTPHGYNVGGAAMPTGVTNNLHLHFTAEVFIIVEGEYTFRWGVDGKQGEVVGRAGDILSVPTWIFRGFTNTGPEENFMFTCLGGDNTGGILWGPSVLREAEGYGLFLTADNVLIDTEAGDVLDPEVELIEPMPEEHIQNLKPYTLEQMARRIVRAEDEEFYDDALLCTRVDGGKVELALVIGFGITEHRTQEPPIYNPHGFSIAVLRAASGQAMLRHRIDETQVVIVRKGRWEVTLNDLDPVTVTLDERDTFSVPVGAWRTYRSVGDETGELLVITGGDGRARMTWDDEVVKAAQNADLGFDANGYIAPWSIVSRTVLDD